MIHRHLISEIKSQKRSRKLYQRLVPADNKKTVKTPGGGEEKHLQKFCMSRYEALLLLSYLLSHFKPRSDWGKFAKILWSIIILYQNWSHSKGIESFHQDWCLMTIKKQKHPERIKLQKKPWCGASISDIGQSVLMSQGSEVHQSDVNSTAPSVSRPIPELTDSLAYCPDIGLISQLQSFINH